MDKKGLLLLIYFGAFIGPFGGNVVLPLIPVFEREFNIGIEVAALTITATIVTFAAFQFVTGAMSDVYGRKRLVILGFAIYAVGSVAAAFSGDIVSFIGTRIIQGAGVAFVAPIFLAMIGDLFSYEERGKVMGGYVASTAIGISLGPLVGGLISVYEWRYVFILIAALCLIMIPLCNTYLKDGPRMKRSIKAVPAIMANALRQRNVFFACITGMLAFMTSASILTFLSDYLGSSPHQVSAVEIGILLSLAGFMGIFVSPVAGFLIDIMGRRMVAMIGSQLMVIAFLIFTIYSREYWQFLPSLIILTLGQTLIFASIGTVIIDSSQASRGAASSIYNTIRFLGYGLGPAVMAPVYLKVGIAGISIVFIFVSVAAIIFSARLKEGKGN